MRVVKKCEICSAPATVFLTQIINGKSTKFCLCAKCAQERGLLDPDAFDLAEKLFPNLQGQFGTKGGEDSPAPHSGASVPSPDQLPDLLLYSSGLQERGPPWDAASATTSLKKKSCPSWPRYSRTPTTTAKRPQERKNVKRKPKPSATWNNNSLWQ